MNFVKSEESAKAAKLIAAIVVVFGCAAWRVAGAVAPASTSAPAPAATPEATAAPAPVAAAPATPKDELIELPKTAAVMNVDPFRTIKGEADPEAVAAIPPTLAGTPSMAAPSGPLSVTPLPTAQFGDTRPAGSIKAASPEPPSFAKAIHLTGTLAGPNATAVLEMGETSQVVRIGTKLDDGSVVVAIDPATVTLKRQGKKRILDVGE